MSRIQKALDAANQDDGSSTHQTWTNRVAPAAASLGEMFKNLISTRLESRVLEKNKLFPALDDRRAITAYKMLRTRVLHRMRANRWQTLIVTGAGPGEGKTLTACNLALSVANDVNQSVILVDLDLQRPTMASYFGINVQAGMGDYLRGRAQIEDIVYAPHNLDRLVIVPTREPLENSSELLASPRMHEFVAWAKDPSRSTIIIFDMPPVLVCDDVLAFSPSADAVLLVAAEGMTNREGLHDAIELITDTNLLGVALNRSREQSAASAYYY